MARGKDYTPEETQYIEDKWGVISVPSIAKKLGRSVVSVQLKARRIGLENPRKATEDVTLVLFCEISGIAYRTIRAWIDSKEFPIKHKVFVKKRIRMVNFHEFWKWAEKHKGMVDLTKFKKNDLGLEPDWADQKRRDDLERKQYRRTFHNQPWTKSEDSKLLFLLNQHKYTYPEISVELGRGEGAIRRRLDELGVKLRPVRLDNHKLYTPEEEQAIKDGVATGKSLEAIAYSIGRSSNAVRGKLERWGYKFKSGVPYLESEEEVR